MNKYQGTDSETCLKLRDRQHLSLSYIMQYKFSLRGPNL